MATALQQVVTDPTSIDVEQAQAAAPEKGLLRFITCGSVDDGKSTLIGRLLYDSQLLLDDQLEALASDSRKAGGGDGLDLALLVDGLAAEREQGITIDVAYRFFATDKRKFIVADTPGHEQYTRNMVTGASTADLAIILVDASKGVLRQTRRHSTLVHLLGIRHLVLAVNKMDLVGYSEERFQHIVDDYRAFARDAGIEQFTAIPLSGFTGANVTAASAALDWFDGPTLLDHLERVTVAARTVRDEPFRMAVQWVNRPNQDFRGYAGTVASGRIRAGDTIAVLPAGRRATVDRIVTYDGDVAEARAGQAVTLTFAEDVDCSRGDVIADTGQPLDVGTRLTATLVGMADQPLVTRRAYWLKLGTQTVSATIRSVRHAVDIDTMEQRPADAVGFNEIAEVEIELARTATAVPYALNRRLGGFILIDRLSHATVAAGMVLALKGATAGGPVERDHPGIVWVAGPSADAYAAEAVRRMRSLGQGAIVIDEQAVRDFRAGARVEGDTLRIARELAGLMERAGVHVLLTIPAGEEEAYPGKRITAPDERDGRGGEWII